MAIFMVLIEHYAWYIGRFFSAGFYGVNLFFVISGFLITSILLRKNGADFKTSYINFLGRRAFRIFPIYYLVILIFILIGVPDLGRDLPYLLTYTFNYHIENIGAWDKFYGLYWSLSVEEQFYVAFPVIVIALKGNIKILTATCLLILLVAYSQILFNVFSLAKYDNVGLLTNMGPLTIGALGAIYLSTNPRMNLFFKSAIVEFIFIFFIITTIMTKSHGFMLLFSSVLNLFLVLKAYYFSFSITYLNRILSNKIIVFIGRISYGIYVYHGIISYYFGLYIFDPVWHKIPFEQLGILTKIEFHSWLIKLPLYSFISILIAYISFKYIESPILKLKYKYL